jgi:hypothetical protein
VSGNLRGVWIQHVGMNTCAGGVPHAVVRNAQVIDNQGVGIGVAAESQGVTIEQSNIENTAGIALPVLVQGVSAGAAVVGDGLNWQGLSHVSLNGVSISASQRASILIDGPVAINSSITNVVLSGGDENKGIEQQSIMSGDVQPTVTGSPAIVSYTEEQHEVPKEIGIPPTI